MRLLTNDPDLDHPRHAFAVFCNNNFCRVELPGLQSEIPPTRVEECAIVPPDSLGPETQIAQAGQFVATCLTKQKQHFQPRVVERSSVAVPKARCPSWLCRPDRMTSALQASELR